MSANLIIIESDSDGSVSSSLKRGIEFESHSLEPFEKVFKPWAFQSRLDNGSRAIKLSADAKR